MIEPRTYEGSPYSRYVFNTTKFSILWLVIRLYVGVLWIEAGIEKVINPAWTGDAAGAAVTGFVNGALQKTGGAHPDVQGWYAAFLEGFVLPNAGAFGYVIAWGELFVGIALVLGILTGIAAFFGAFMNMSFLLAGTVSINPEMLFLSILLILSWRVAGYIGLDKYVVPKMGVSWQSGHIFRR